jgi:TctA family transporter
MLLPLTFKLEPTGRMIMLAGIYYGAKYGGSTTSILLNVPGESSSVVTCIDGYQMARKGRAGAALGMAAIASFIAGTFGVLALMLVRPPLAKLSLAFSAPEYFALMVLGLTMVTLLAGESLVKALLAMLVGLWIASMGTDLFTATSRFTFGRVELLGGIDFIIVAIGVFAIGEVLANMEPDETGRDAAGAEGVEESHAHLGRHEEVPLRLRERLDRRVPDRHPARRGLDHRVVHELRHREGGLEASRGIRPRRDRGCRRARGRQQRGDGRGARAAPARSAFPAAAPRRSSSRR